MIGVLCLLSLLLGCASETRVERPRVIDGEIDLGGWSFAEDGPIKIQGDWLFAWGAFLPIAPWDALKEQMKVTQPVPGLWRRTGRPKVGHATYAVRVTNVDASSVNLLLQRGQSAATVIIASESGQPLGYADYGIPGDSIDTEKPIPNGSKSLQVHGLDASTSANTAFTIIIHVSNFHHARGGLKEGPTLDLIPSATRERNYQLFRSYLLLGALLILGIYHMILFAMNHQRNPQLFFALFCFSMAARECAVSGFISMMTIQSSVTTYTLHYQVEYASVSCVIAALLGFIHHVLPSKIFYRFFLIWGVGLGSILALFVASTEVVTFTEELILLEVLIAGAALGLLPYLLYHAKERKPIAIQLLAAVGILTLGAFNDILHNNEVINTAFVSPYTVLLFALIQAVALARETKRIYDEQRTLSERTLMQTVQITSSELVARRAAEARAEAEVAHRLEAESKVRLFSNTVHHLNNPLNHIQGAQDWLTRNNTKLKKVLNSSLHTDPIDQETEDVRIQFETKFNENSNSLDAIASAISRAAKSVGTLRKVSGVDGFSTKAFTVNDLCDAFQDRLGMTTVTNLDELRQRFGAVDFYGDPAFYVHVLELIEDELPTKCRANLRLELVPGHHEHHLKYVDLMLNSGTFAELKRTEELANHLLKPTRATLTVAHDFIVLQLPADSPNEPLLAL